MRAQALILLILVCLTTAARSGAQPAARPVRIPLDSTGIADWSFLNPANVQAVESRAVEFENTTSDRTFIVSMPFVLGAAEFGRAFATARLQREGRRTLADVACDAFVDMGGDVMSPARRDLCEAARDDLERIEELRVLLESFTAVGEDPPDVTTCDPNSPACAVERTYWAAACQFCAVTGLSTFDARQAEFDTILERTARAEVQRFINSGRPTDIRELLCDIAQAAVLNKRVIRSDSGVLECTPVEAAQGAVGVLDKAIDAVGDAETIKNFRAERTRRAKASLIEATRGELTDTLRMDSIEKVRKALEDEFSNRERNARQASTRDEAERQGALAAKIEAASKLLRSYSADSPVPFRWQTATSTNMDTRTSDLAVSVEDCQAPSGGTVRCTATATIPARQLARFSNATLRHSPDDLIRFNVSFFGQTTPPPNAVAFVRLKPAPEGKLLIVPAQFAIGLGVDGGTAYDLSRDLTGHRRHTFGTGTAAIGFSGGIVDSSVSLRFKQGDFGGPATTQTVDVAEYQAKVFGPKGIALQVGEFSFARPSSGIALSERGEGILVAFRKFTASYIVHRANDEEEGTANRPDDEFYVALGQLKNLTIKGTPFLDGIDFTLAYGNNKGDDPTAGQTLPGTAYTYTTFGSEARISFSDLARFTRIRNAAMSFAAYHSQRQIRSQGSNPLPKGRGTVGLVTFGWRWSGNAALFARERKARPPYGPTFTIGRGTGDDDPSDGRDEGYLGENAGFAADRIFLSQLSRHKDYEPTLGRGLKNKWYGGVQWSDARGSLLGWVAGIIGKQASIVSRNTIVSLHTYRFVHPVHSRHTGGMELDVEFQVESPAKVTWSLGGAYYHRSRAVELAGLTSNLWQITASVAFKLQHP